jgi:hypothetical protein
MANNGRTKTFGSGSDNVDLRWPQGLDGFFDNANGGLGADTIQGNGNDNIINGDGGNDRLIGDFGADTMSGGTGDDRLFGEFGNDVLRGGDGADTLDGGWDNDNLSGGLGNDRLLGDLGDDVMNGDAGLDIMFGGNGSDVMNGGADADQMFGGFDGDVMDGGLGNDTLRGEDGGDDLRGGDGADLIFADEAGQILADNDVVRGGLGNDTIHSHTGVDQLFGDDGNDVFVYNDFLSNRMITSSVQIDGGAGSDTVLLKGQVLPVVNIGADPMPVLRLWDTFSSVERIDIEQDAGDQTLTFGYRDVQDISGTDVLTIDGEVGDRVHLFNFVTGDVQQGAWTRVADQSIGGELFRVYDFDPYGAALPVAQIRIDYDVGVSIF